MKPRILACFLTLLAAVPAGAQQRYIVRAPSGTVQKLASKNRLTIVRQSDVGGQTLALLADTAGRSAAGMSSTLRSQLPSGSAEPDSTVRIPETPSGAQLNQSTVAILDALKSRTLTPFYGASLWDSYLNQPAAGIIKLPQSRAYGTGQGIVAVIDTGVDPNHPALSGSLTWGYDFINERFGIPSEFAGLDQSTVAILDGNSTSLLNKTVAQVNQSTVAILDQSTVAILDGSQLPACFGHGTMVAGLVHLVAPTAHIMPLRAFNSDGTGTTYDVVRAVYFAVLAGARVINMSFSMDAPSKELQAALDFARSRGVVCIASAGNSGMKTMVYPAGLNSVDGIGATNNSDRRSDFSNYGNSLVSLAAPGEDLITSYPGNSYAAVSGTSFSTALVSGAVAVLSQIDFNLNQAQADNALDQAQPVGQELGAGRLDLLQACQYARRH